MPILRDILQAAKNQLFRRLGESIVRNLADTSSDAPGTGRFDAPKRDLYDKLRAEETRDPTNVK